MDSTHSPWYPSPKRENIMKHLWKILLLCAAVLFVSFDAQAKDGGDEKAVPILRWKCYMCDINAFTFAPDSLDGKKGSSYKDPVYQQKNWVRFFDPSRPLPKCPKSPDGGHFFESKGGFTASPAEVFANGKMIVVLKEGGGKIKAKVVDCKFKGTCFDGDDMDMAESIMMRMPSAMMSMANGSRSPNCVYKWRNFEYLMHMPKEIGKREVSSYELAYNLRRVWFSK